MEGYQMFFPISSSSSIPNMATGHYSSQVLNNFNGNYSNGLLGLKSTSNGSESFIQRPEVKEVVQDINNNGGRFVDGDISNSTDQIIMNKSSSAAANGNVNSNEINNKKKEKKVKKPKYAFQTRSQVDILDDGYRWRKYGQKAVKNNKFPRSYYRCTHQGCNVKKQVQRLTKDEGVVVTTYEGMHTHPIERPTDNFEHILSQMQIYSTTPF